MAIVEVIAALVTRRRTPGLALAAAWALACSSPSWAEAPRSGRSSPRIDLAVSQEWELEGYRQGSSVGGCPGPVEDPGYFVGHLQLDLDADKRAGSLEWIEVTGGRVEYLYVAPNGRRARVLVRGDGAKAGGDQRLTVRYRRRDGRVAEREVAFQTEGISTVLPEAQYPDPRQAVMFGPICDPAPGPTAEVMKQLDEQLRRKRLANPPPVQAPQGIFSSDGPVAFGGSDPPPSGWATDLAFEVGLRDGKGVVPVLGGGPGIEGKCSTGALPRYDYNSNGTFSVWYSPRPADGSGRLQGGDHTCIFRFRVRRPDGREEVVAGKLGVHIAPDGTVTLGRAQKKSKK